MPALKPTSPLFSLIFLSLLFIVKTTQVSAAGLERSGRWFTYDGQPSYLVGFDAQELAANPNIDYVAMLDLFSRYKINKVRIWTYIWFGSSFGPLTPWAKDANGKHNLDKWNPAYWTRVKNFIAKAQERKIVVEISIFAPYPAADWWWLKRPIAWNKSNNTNGAFSSNSRRHFQPQFFDLKYGEKSNSGKSLKDYQQALLDKVVREFGGYNNVYFEVMNEFGTYKLDVNQWHTWQLNWAQRIRNTSSRLISISAGGGKDPFYGSLYWNQASLDVLTVRTTASPQGISDMLHSAQLKGKVLSLNETTGNYADDLDRHTQYAWGMFMSGGYVGIYQDVSSNIGNSSWIAMANRLKALREIAEKAEFSTLSPVDGAGNEYDSLVIQGPSGKNRQVLANPGSGYVVYFWGSKSNTAAKIQLPSGNYTYEWYNALNATLIGSGTVSGGGSASIPAPPTSSWSKEPGLALIIKSIHLPDRQRRISG